MLAGGKRIARENVFDTRYVEFFARGPRHELLRLLLSKMVAPLGTRYAAMDVVIREIEQIEKLGADGDHKTDTGRMKISSPELTALDLLRYAHITGTIDSIATVLSDLGGKMRPEPLAKLAPAFERTVVQRLGYLLDHLKHSKCAAVLHDRLQQCRPPPWVELEPNRRGTKSSESLERNSRWNVIVRRLPELDE